MMTIVNAQQKLKRLGITVIKSLLLLSIFVVVSECETAVPTKPDGSGPDCPGCGTWTDYHNADRFQWTDPDQQAHLIVSFAGVMLASYTLEKICHVPGWQAALYGTMIGITAGMIHELYFDHYTSRTDLKTLSAGSIAGGISYVIIRY